MNPEDNEQEMATAKVPMLVDECNKVRGAIKEMEKTCRAIKDKIQSDSKTSEQAFPGQFAEMLGQITLAFRHLEDARMRVGKVIQYAGDGVSVYDK